MLKRILRSRRGEGYIDVCVLVLCAMLVIALAVQVLPAFIAKQQLDIFATELAAPVVSSDLRHDGKSWITVRKSRPYRSALAEPTPLTARSSVVVRGREIAISRRVLSENTT